MDKTINDLAIMLAMRGISQLQAARECGIHAVSFNQLYAHGTPTNRSNWRKVLKVMRDKYNISYDPIKGFYLITEAEKRAENQRILDTMLREKCYDKR